MGKNAGSSSSFEATRTISYSVISNPVVSSVSLGADKPSPQVVAPAPGGTITFTALASGVTGNYVYQFWC